MRGLEDSALKIQIHSIPIAKFRIKEASDPSPEKIKYPPPPRCESLKIHHIENNNEQNIIKDKFAQYYF